MRGLGFFPNLRVRSQLFIVYSCLFALVLVVGGEIALASMRASVEESIRGELRHATDLVLAMVRTSAQTAARGHLRSLPEEERETAEHRYGLSPQGELLQELDMAPARDSREFRSAIGVDDLVAAVLAIDIGDSGYAFIVDGGGNAIAHPQLEGELLEVTDAAGFHYVRDMCARKSGEVEYAQADPDTGDQRRVLVSFGYLPELDWIAAVARPEDSIFGPLHEMRRIWNVAAGLSLVLVLTLTFSASERASRSLRGLAGRLELVAAGDLSGGADEQPPGEDEGDAPPWSGSGDEVAALSQALDRIRDRLLSIVASARVIAAGDLSQAATGEGDLVGAFNQILGSLRQIVVQTRDAAGQIDTAVARMSAASSEQTSSAAQQSGSISEVTSTMTELSRTSKEVTDSSERVVEIAAQTQGDAHSGVEAAKATLVAMDAIRETHEQSTKGVVSLADKVQQISEVMDIIDDIADNTKLIAFNAALEAAGAGEAGRRFGVVAQEIRRLADTVVEATEDSRGRIEEIQEATNSMVVASERNSRVFEAGFVATQATADSLQKILDSASNTADSARQISLSTQQERTAMQQILDAMVEVSEGATHFASKVNETNETATSLRGLAAELTELIGKYEVDESPE